MTAKSVRLNRARHTETQTTSAMRQAIALAASLEAGEGGAPDQLLASQFGSVNARVLVRDHRGAVNKLRTAQSALLRAINLWDETPRSALRLARTALSYHERMCDLSLLCSSPIVRPSIQRATKERRRERAAYHRDRRNVAVY
jgi:hypothetical protein